MNRLYVKPKEVTFLIIDDDIVQVKTLIRAMNKLKILNPVLIANDGEQALEILRGADADSNAIPRCIAILDLNMPRMGGLEFLDEIRNDPLLSKLVVFIFSSSNSPEDVRSAYEQNVAGYIWKESVDSTLKEAIEMLSGYSQLIVLPD